MEMDLIQTLREIEAMARETLKKLADGEALTGVSGLNRIKWEARCSADLAHQQLNERALFAREAAAELCENAMGAMAEATQARDHHRTIEASLPERLIADV